MSGATSRTHSRNVASAPDREVREGFYEGNPGERRVREPITEKQRAGSNPGAISHTKGSVGTLTATQEFKEGRASSGDGKVHGDHKHLYEGVL